MAPAPKASRVRKGEIVTDSNHADVQSSEGQLIDVGEGTTVEEIHRNRLEPMDSRSHSPASPKTTFFMRRSSSTADGNIHAPVAVRGNVNDMREHLKHLGPSNLASRPKTTRYNTVKIKPGHGASSSDGSKARQSSIVEEPYRDDPAPQGGEGEGLLKSAGIDAKDGVQAVQQGYGSLDRRSSFSHSPSKDAKGLASRTKHDLVQTKSNGGASTAKVEALRRPGIKRGTSAESGYSSDTLGSLKSLTESPMPRKRNPARSGSITESIVDAGGVRKVVLETTSSSDDIDPEVMNEGVFPTTNKRSTDVASASTPNTSTNQPEGEEVKRKQKRRRKRKGGKGSEDASGSATVQEE
jgi:metal transporter CNNM